MNSISWRLPARRRWLVATVAAAAAVATTGVNAVLTNTPAAATASSCTTSTELSGTDASNFEVDTNSDGANLKVDGASPCIDWLTTDETAFRSGVFSKPDQPTGTNDDSFGQGTAENDPVPTVVSGSIPPNKSDLSRFGIYLETEGNTAYLALFWARVQNPKGTTNMDFEFNQNKCVWDSVHNTDADGSNCSSNHVTPKRSDGDMLITYDLSKGGTVPTISEYTWSGTATSGSWTLVGVLSGSAGDAIGSVNSTAIATADDGPVFSGLSPFTFGEAVINLTDILSGSCKGFGSTYLKSRSSDSFTSEIKDFIAPEVKDINLCNTLTTAQTWYPNDSASITQPDGTTKVTTGSVRFRLQTDQNSANTTGVSHCYATDHTPTSDFLYDETDSSADSTTHDFATTNGPSASTPFAAHPTTSTKYYWLVEWLDGTTVKIASCVENSTLITANGSGVQG